MIKSFSGALLCSVMGSALFGATAVPVGSQRRLAFNDGWRFFKGEAAGAEKPNFQDSSWTEVRLPHDWAIEGPFDSKLNPHTGALPIFGTAGTAMPSRCPFPPRGAMSASSSMAPCADPAMWGTPRKHPQRLAAPCGERVDYTQIQ